ncbi:MAG TPA: hypothetical protein VJS92_01225 [Candidatus Polarisedimenticolaceae bacterium]|nr:hypothetical protein [Candidatus Polarisedimenticolaceae bacterium]
MTEARCGALVALLLSLGTSAPAAEPEALYDQGRYAEACPLLEQRVSGGRTTGPLLYRLFYCQQWSNAPTSQQTLERAREQLEAELSGAAGLETPFYLANAYSNLGRTADAKRVAADATQRIESGQWPKPVAGVDQFRLGKLYADQERPEEALAAYDAALTAFAAEPDPPRPYVKWAARYVAERAYAAKDWERAAHGYSQLLAEGQGTQDEYDRFASSQARLGHWQQAGAAWNKSELANPGEGDRARYCKNLMMRAAELPSLPAATPEGRSFSTLSQAELETVMSDQAKVVRETIQQAQEAPKLKKKQRREMQARLDAARPLFVAAALEYALQGYSLRETAFAGGYAPLIFRPAAWELPPPTSGRRDPPAPGA